MDHRTALAALEQRLGHVFADKALLERALTHASVSGVAADVQHNEQLEFLGDRVLGLLAAERLLELHPSEREGPLSHRMHSAVSREACARVARALRIEEALRRAGVSVRKPSTAADTLLADAVEAILAALYLDGGLEAARALFRRVWEAELAGTTAVDPNPKVALQLRLAEQGRPPPRYLVAGQTGPAHQPTFEVEVQADGREPLRALGRSRQEAEKAAARLMLERDFS